MKFLLRYHQNYLELAVGYVNEGMLAEAEDVLLRYTGENPIVNYYLGYIQDQLGNKDQAEKYFRTAQGLSEDYCFPFRLETIKILKAAINYNEILNMDFEVLTNDYGRTLCIVLHQKDRKNITIKKIEDIIIFYTLVQIKLNENSKVS